MINTPYKKEMKNGIIMNPIEAMFLSPFPNRSARRGTGGRFKGNHKGHSLSVGKNFKYHRVTQNITLPSGKVKVINHDVL